MDNKKKNSNKPSLKVTPSFGSVTNSVDEWKTLVKKKSTGRLGLSRSSTKSGANSYGLPYGSGALSLGSTGNQVSAGGSVPGSVGQPHPASILSALDVAGSMFKKLLPLEIQKKCLELGWDSEFCSDNFQAIFNVGRFLHPKLFSTTLRSERRDFCTEDRRNTALALIEPPEKPLKKMFKSLAAAGSGGFGSVYVSRPRVVPQSAQTKMGKRKKQKVAIKKVSHNNPQEKQTNLDELGFLASLSHPNIVNFFYALHVKEPQQNEEIWIVTEYLLGGTLADASSYGEWPENSVAFVAWQILKALDYLHSFNIAHRDLKSTNVMMSVKGEIKLIDFGLCCDFTKGKREEIVGTPHWISPEMILGEPHGVAVDIWSLGVCILELFTHHPPHPNDTFKCMVLAASTGLASEIPKDHPRLCRVGRSFIRNCLSVDPEKRPTAKQLLKDKWIKINARKDKGGIIKVLTQIFMKKTLHDSGLLLGVPS